jgi:lipopolysaccharide/colanic/teichoic acid biosynthesis glycosyltransferase
VKPGITGLAQIEGRDDLNIEERTALDEQYVLHRALRLDLRIIARTFREVFSGSGD